MNLKQQLYRYCQDYVIGITTRIQNNIKNIQEALNSETKSSAGDKHETGRAMLQLEREKLGQQLAQAEKMNAVLSKVPIANKTKIISLGSLVKTTKSNYYLAISAGEHRHEDESIFCISAMTPMGQLLLGNTIGDIVHFNGEQIEITAIV